MIYWNAAILLLVISLLINILFIWYLRQLLARFAYVCANIYELKKTVDLYMGHLSLVSELEMFHKDPHIEELMQHTVDMVAQLKTYEEFYELLSVEDLSAIPARINTEGNETDEREGNDNSSETQEEKAQKG